MRIFDPLPEHKILSLMPTFRCTAECQNCGTMSSPRENTWLPLSKMLSVIDQAAESGYGLVVFTGGEPTLAGKDLLAAIERAHHHNLLVRIVTNAHWARNREVASAFIKKLIDAGLSEINFSTGDQHSKFVPIERVLNATYAAAKAKLRVSIMVETLKERNVTKESIENNPMFRGIRQELVHAYINVHESPWMPLSPSSFNSYPANVVVANSENIDSFKGCDSILSTTTVQANGKIGACCGLGMRLVPELQLGSVDDTALSEAANKAANDFLKRWIKVEGPEKILAWAASHDSDVEWENMYAHRCQACLRIYSDPKVREVISKHYKEKMVDVVFSEYLLHHYDNSEGRVEESACT